VSSGAAPDPACVSTSSLTETITAIFAWATAHGCPIQLGTCAIAMLCPAMELLDVSCGEAIRRILKFLPDVVSWTDYTTNPPTINFASRYDLPVATLELSDFGADGFSAKPRPDLIPPQIVIVYEITQTVDGTPGINIQIDAVPDGATGDVPRALVMTIPIHGANESFAKQRLRCQAIPLNFAAANGGGEALQTLGRFYKQFVPQFQLCDSVDGDAQTPNLTFYPLNPSDPDTYYEIALAQPDGVNDANEPFVYLDPSDTGSTQLTLDTTLTNCMLEGQQPPWMYPNTKAQVQAITFRASWTMNNGSIQGGIDPITGQPGIRITVILTATNGISQTYHYLQQWEGSEGVPAGLAAALTASLGILQYEGKATIVAPECEGPMPLGAVLNVVNGRSEWESMAALIQEVEEDIFHGKTTAKFGPPAHLQITDAIALMRMGRPPDWDTRAAGANTATQYYGTYPDRCPAPLTTPRSSPAGPSKCMASPPSSAAKSTRPPRRTTTISRSSGARSRVIPRPSNGPSPLARSATATCRKIPATWTAWAPKPTSATRHGPMRP
jgi:hypothetical protein